MANVQIASNMAQKINLHYRQSVVMLISRAIGLGLPSNKVIGNFLILLSS